MSKWLKITAEEPPVDTIVILSGYIKNNRKNGRWVETGSRDEDGQFYGDDYDRNNRDPFYPPTHYMTLPDPPYGEEE